MRKLLREHPVLCGIGLALALMVACAAPPDPATSARYRWWAGLGPVLPHDTFPADCHLCHVGEDWNTLVKGFEFDHERETGVRLEGAHEQARCHVRGGDAAFAPGQREIAPQFAQGLERGKREWNRIGHAE